MAAISDEVSDDVPHASIPNKASGPSSSSGINAAGPSGLHTAPTGHGLRRAQTIDETSSLRRRSLMGQAAPEASFEPTPPLRRSSNFSDYSYNLGEARDILNPRPQDGDVHRPESSYLASISLAFALLPALAGTFFKNGSAVVTDVMLLSLAAVFLNWSVTQPWSWYHSAQTVRIQQEANAEAAIVDDGDLEPHDLASHAGSPLEDVPEGDDESARPDSEEETRDSRVMAKQQAAIRELYIHEILALVSCFLLPLIGAYLLHAIRSQLSRPSEGLVSNYNLTIFLLASELRVFSHMIKLVQSRTLHLQKVIHENPFAISADVTSRLDDLSREQQRLESRLLATEQTDVQRSATTDSSRTKQEAALARDVRNAIQPDLDALNRAVRRYEKKATILQHQTEARYSALDARLDDAIALAAAAAKNSFPQKNVAVRAMESTAAIVLFPLSTVLQILLLPLKTLLGLVTGSKQNAPPPRSSRAPRASRSQPRYSGDRVPSRVTKR